MVQQTTINASPNKSFFVSMLTRDIELEDAILDLLDNSLDGVTRILRSKGQSLPITHYEEHFAELIVTPQEFRITDNCGGIPIDIAKNSAFRMGRSLEDGREPGAIGVYGIGLKRAMFKMGRSSFVETSHSSGSLRVTISQDWLLEASNWDLPYSDNLTTGVEAGTVVSVSELYQEVAHQFDIERSNFVKDLRKTIAQKYSLILGKGFRISLNGAPILPQLTEFLCTHPEANSDSKISPFYLSTEIGTVRAEMICGFYRSLPDEEDDEGEVSEYTSTDAGWSVACNDRIVVYKDKSRLTGWGEAGVPMFHQQFTSITGLLRLYADDPLELPITTTKRGLDTSSDVYLKLKDHMRSATKIFTGFTNAWKKVPKGRSLLFASAHTLNLDEIRGKLDGELTKRTIKGEDLLIYRPDLPKPGGTEDAMANIAFKRLNSEVVALKSFLYEEPENVSNSQLGDACFERVLRESEKAE